MVPSTQQPTRSTAARNQANTRRNLAKVEEYLMNVEKTRGYAKSWELRERLERGDVTLGELTQR
jgi:hypothetical protein